MNAQSPSGKTTTNNEIKIEIELARVVQEHLPENYILVNQSHRLGFTYYLIQKVNVKKVLWWIEKINTNIGYIRVRKDDSTIAISDYEVLTKISKDPRIQNVDFPLQLILSVEDKN